MERLLARRKNQIVVIDGPPLLATNEAQVLASLAGQVVMVVASGSTPRDLVVKALESIDQCPHVSTVLNKSDVPAVPRGYGYY
jgi:Mrp family chromosome partitioning ATPase